VQVAREYSEQLGSDKLIEMFSTYKSWEGLFYYLGAILTKTEDKEVHFKYIEAAAKVGNMQEVERVTREDNFYDPERVRPRPSSTVVGPAGRLAGATPGAPLPIQHAIGAAACSHPHTQPPPSPPPRRPSSPPPLLCRCVTF
jgi:hypothetical protein